MEPTWTDEHDRLVEYAEPQVPEPSAADLALLWSRIDAGLGRAGGEEESPGRRGRRRLRAGIATGLGAVVLGTSGLAVADHFSAHTGRGPKDAEDLRLGGPGEYLAMAASDYGEVVAEVTADIPFPSRAAREWSVRDQLRDARFEGTDSVISTGALRSFVADQALCSWSNQWAAATRSGDEAARTEAMTMIQDAPTWPAVVAVDPEPYRRWETLEVEDGTGHVTTERAVDESHFFYLSALGRAVEGRRLDAVARVLAASNGYCRPGNVPDLPSADPLDGER